MPVFGAVAFRKDSKDLTIAAVKSLIDSGIRHFEISELFGNGHMIVEACRQSNLSRSDIFITYKVWPKDSRGAELKSRCVQNINATGLDFVDLLLLHSPIDVDNRIDQYNALETLVSDKITRGLGLCNYSTEHIISIMKYSTIAPVVVETEVSPLGQDTELTEFCIDSSIAIICNNPFNKNIKLNHHPTVSKLAASLGMSVEQVVIRWIYTKGFAVFLSAGPWNSGTNYETANEDDLLLSEDVMSVLNSLDENVKTSWIPMAKDDDE